MNLRSKLFKKPWQNSDADIRAAAVRDEQDPELKADLPRLAQSDESARVRLAALQRLNTEPFWLDARLRETDAEIVSAADQFLAREVLRSHRRELESARVEWLGLIHDGKLIRQIASSSPSLELRRAALRQITAQGFLGDCFVRESDDGLAAELLDRLDQASTLERIIQEARRSNKRRAQAAGERLEALRIAAGTTPAGQAASERLVLEAEALTRGGASDLAAELAELRKRWDSSADHPPALARRFYGAVKILDSTLEKRSQAATAVAESDSEDPVETATPEAEPDPRLAESADFIRTSIRKAAAVEARQLLAHWDRAWNQLAAASVADEALKAEMLPLLRELQAQVQMQSKPDRPEATADAPTAKGEIRISFEAQLDEIAQTLESGELSAAQTLIKRLRSDYDRLSPRQRSRAEGGRLQRMEGRLKEMRNWQHWSNNKIRDELIASVAELPSSGQHPDAIMAALKQARAEWQRLEALERLPDDKRRFAAPPGQWRQFQAACKQAFETSKPYFEKRDQVLHDNLDALQAFTRAGLEAAADQASETATLLGFLRKARQAIRRMDDLPTKSRGASAAALRDLMNQLSSTLDQRFEAAEAVKRRLVAEARALTHEKDLKAALDKAKALQSQWQKAPAGRRKIDQALWREFREPIDPLFQQAKGEQDQRRQADQETQAELKALCEQVEALAELPDTELESARGRLLGLVDEWLRQETRPEGLSRRFQRAEQRFEDRVLAYRASLQQAADSQVRALAEQVQALWSQRCGDASGDLAVELPTDAMEDPAGKHLLELAQLIATPDSDLAGLEERARSNYQSARQIAVELEFLSGLDTPTADQALRMDYQVQRLARRMSEREQQPDLATELKQLNQRWYRCLPQPPEHYAELHLRVEKAQAILRRMAGL